MAAAPRCLGSDPLFRAAVPQILGVSRQGIQKSPLGRAENVQRLPAVRRISDFRWMIFLQVTQFPMAISADNYGCAVVGLACDVVQLQDQRIGFTAMGAFWIV